MRRLSGAAPATGPSPWLASGAVPRAPGLPEIAGGLVLGVVCSGSPGLPVRPRRAVAFRAYATGGMPDRSGFVANRVLSY